VGILFGTMNVITKHDSSLIVYNSADAIRVDSRYGNGDFTCRMSNVNRAGSHAIKLVPHKVLIPNVFNNVKDGANQIQTQTNVFVPVADVLVTPGFYALAALLAKLNSSVGGIFGFTFDSSTSRIVLTNLHANEHYLIVDVKVAEMLGFSYTAAMVSGSRVSFVVNGAASIQAATVPYLGTSPIVHVIASKAAKSNLLSSNGTEYSVLASVDMTASGFGQYASYEAADLYLGDIDFRSPRDLSDIDFRITDANFETLAIDPRFHVIIQLKVFHTDTEK
jgi:hypothetical protein